MAVPPQMSLPVTGVQMVGQAGMMGAPGVPGSMMAHGALPVSTVPGAMQPGMVPAHGMGIMPVSSVGMGFPGNQVIMN